jgi:hypothetical protein
MMQEHQIFEEEVVDLLKELDIIKINKVLETSLIDSTNYIEKIFNKILLDNNKKIILNKHRLSELGFGKDKLLFNNPLNYRGTIDQFKLLPKTERELFVIVHILEELLLEREFVFEEPLTIKKDFIVLSNYIERITEKLTSFKNKKEVTNWIITNEELVLRIFGELFLVMFLYNKQINKKTNLEYLNQLELYLEYVIKYCYFGITRLNTKFNQFNKFFIWEKKN